MKKFKFLTPVKPKTDIKSVFSGDEIILKDLANLFLERKRIVLIFAVLSLIIGILSVATTKDLFVASTVIVPESSGGADSNSKRKIKGIASLAGVGSFGSEGSTNLTSPNFYPEIVQNELFLMDLLEEKFRFAEFKKRMSLLEYFNNYEFDNTVTYWWKRLSKGKLPESKEEFEKSDKTGFGQAKYKGDSTSNVIEISSQQKKAMAALRKLIVVEQDLDNGLISISVEMPEGRVSAEVANLVMRRMIDFAVDHKTRKEKRNLEFVRNREQLARSNFEDTQYEFAEFVDRNQNVISAKVLAKEEQLRTELKIITSIYSQLAAELESAQITLQEQTPVYSIFKPVIVPRAPEKTNHILTLLIHLFAGVFIGFVVVASIIIRGLLK